MKENLLAIIKTKTIKDSAVTFTGTFLAGFLGAIFYILLAKYLGPENFGLFSVSVLVLTLLVDVGNLGTNTGIVRFVGKYIGFDKDKALKFLKLGLEIKLIVAFLVGLVGYFLVPFVALNIFQKTEFVLPLRIAIWGMVGLMSFSFVTSSLDALQKYKHSNFLSVATNAFRLIVVLILFSISSLTLPLSLVIYGTVPLLGFFFGLKFLPNFLIVKNEWGVSKEFFGFNAWVALFAAIAAIASRLDSFIASRFLDLRELGIYSVAVTLVSIVPQVVLALGVVVAPKLASFESDEKAVGYLKKLQIFVGALCLLGIIVGIPLSSVFINNFYGAAYSESVLPFSILLISQALFLFSVPIHSAVIYYFSYPKLFVFTSVIHILIISILGWVLIQNFGYMGAAVTSLIGSVSNFVIPTLWVINKFKKR